MVSSGIENDIGENTCADSIIFKNDSREVMRMNLLWDYREVKRCFHRNGFTCHCQKIYSQQIASATGSQVFHFTGDSLNPTQVIPLKTAISLKTPQTLSLTQTIPLKTLESLSCKPFHSTSLKIFQFPLKIFQFPLKTHSKPTQ